MAKERAARRAEREQLAARRAEEQAAVRERERRRAARRTTLRRWLPARASGPTGVLADRRRGRIRMVIAVVLFVQILVWIIRPDWPARLGALVIALVLLPVLLAFTA